MTTQNLTPQQLRAHLRSKYPLDAAMRKRGRMGIIGKNFIESDGSVMVPNGYNYGHGEIWLPGDPAEDKSMGATAVRLIVRFYGGGSYTDPTKDAMLLGGFANMTPEYMAYVVAQFSAAKAAGLRTILARDSNCGQSAYQGYPDDPSMYNGCTVDGVPGSNFFTPTGQGRRQAFIDSQDVLMQVLYGLVDMVEPLVEPSAPGISQADVWVLQQQMRDVTKARDPDCIMLIGSYPGYAPKSAANAYNPAWAAASDTAYTCDMLDFAASDTANLGATLSSLRSIRDDHGAPIFVNQGGTNSSTDPDDSKYAAYLEHCRSGDGGSIGNTIWERVSRNTGSFGTWTCTGNDPTVRVLKPNRRAVTAAAFSAQMIPA